MTTYNIYISSDTLVKVTGLTDESTEEYVNDATITMALYRELVLHPDMGSTVEDSGDGKIQVQINSHGLTTDDYVRLVGFQDYNDESGAVLEVIDENTVKLNISYSNDEECNGHESIYVALRRSNGTWPISLAYQAGTNGNYYGILPKDILGLVHGNFYWLFVDIVKDSSRLVSRLDWRAVYHPGI